MTRARAVLRAAATPFGSAQRGSAVVAVMLVAVLAGAVGVAAWTLAATRLQSAERRIAQLEARALARSAVQAAAGWFEARERDQLVDPPTLAQVDRDSRIVDADGDGRGTPWRSATPPYAVRYKEGATGAVLFRPPDGPAPEDRFLGTAEGPDVVLTRGAAGADVLASLDALLAPGRPARSVRLAIFEPAAGSPGTALATVEVVVEREVPGGAPIRVSARGDIVRAFDERFDRPLVSRTSAEFSGDAGWGRGEALIGGDLVATDATWRNWPGGIPWVDVDRPLRGDVDGDGTLDDRDGDGVDDWTQWRALGGDVPDPWWRARVGGAWPGVLDAPGPCEAAMPFGPWASPPRPPTKIDDRSGVRLGCPGGAPIEPVPRAWQRLAAAGVRGARHARETASRPGSFQLDGIGREQSLSELVSVPGLLLLSLATSRTGPLEVLLTGNAGALVVDGGDAHLVASTTSRVGLDAPADPFDTDGAERAGRVGDDHLTLVAASAACDAWRIGDWVAGDATPAPELRQVCDPGPADYRGIIAVTGRLQVDGPLRIVGQLRAGTLALAGDRGPVRSVAPAAGLDDPGDRPGPPGTPRVAVTNLRTAP